MARFLAVGGNDAVVSPEVASRYAVEFELELDDDSMGKSL